MTHRPYSSFFAREWTYDVFLNFRGEDTRRGFTSNLYNSLRQKGIHAFMDDEGLRRGEEIKPALLKAIQESRTAILVFSKNYASSTFCLDELVKILECFKADGRLVWPIFYDVDPSQARHQTGTYADALEQHEKRFHDNKERVQRWRKALCQAANLSGWDFQQWPKQEYKFIKKITNEVSWTINHTPLHISNNPVGLEFPVQELTSLLGLGSDEGVNMIGIYGIGGIGKTTIARAVYNWVADRFEGLCFLANIREKATNKHGLVQLQETLLSQILGEKDIKLEDVNRGISIIKWRLQLKKVLLILDDVDKLMQLNVLAGGYDWFGSGSRIIITTRDKQLLATHGVVKLYEVEQLNDQQARDLFNWHAFKSNKVDLSYVDISNRAVSYACGLPLALEVIGSHVFGKSLEECNSALDKYERIPHKEIHEMLKVSYDSLEENEKGIFLDIACFFNTDSVGYVKEMLYAHGFHVEDGLRVLVDKSLIKIDGSDCVRMHDLIQDMGREIVRQESIFPGKRSRLWLEDDIVHVLEENTGTDTIEVIFLWMCNNKEVQWSGKAFKKMKNLRILIIGNAHFSTDPKHLPNSLRVLDWSGSPSLPHDYNPKKLVILSLPESCFKLFQPLQAFESLKFINFEGCKFLTELPSLHGVPNLEALILDKCTDLIRIHDSVGFLYKLILLSAQGCTQLEILAPCIKLISLETLDLGECSNLKSFPEVLGKMDKIREVYLDETSIDKLPLSIGNLVGLERLYLRQCKRLNQLPSSIHILPKVEVILAYECRGYRFFEGYEVKEKMSSEVSPSAMFVYNKGYSRFFHLRPRAKPILKQRLVSHPFGTPCASADFLDVYSVYMSHDNAIEVCSPNWLEHPNFEFLFKMLETRSKNWFMPRSRKSYMHFWFRKKFPKIALCCSGKPNWDQNNLVLDFKFSVFINGTRQFSSSCTYITCSKEQILWCDLQCKVEGAFSEHEWNKVWM